MVLIPLTQPCIKVAAALIARILRREKNPRTKACTRMTAARVSRAAASARRFPSVDDGSRPHCGDVGIFEDRSPPPFPLRNRWKQKPQRVPLQELRQTPTLCAVGRQPQPIEPDVHRGETGVRGPSRSRPGLWWQKLNGRAEGHREYFATRFISFFTTCSYSNALPEMPYQPGIRCFSNAVNRRQTDRIRRFLQFRIHISHVLRAWLLTTGIYLQR